MRCVGLPNIALVFWSLVRSGWTGTGLFVAGQNWDPSDVRGVVGWAGM